MDSPTTRQAMAAAGVDRALTRYEPAQIATEIDHVYRRVTEASGQAPLPR